MKKEKRISITISTDGTRIDTATSFEYADIRKIGMLIASMEDIKLELLNIFHNTPKSYEITSDQIQNEEEDD